MSQFPSISFQNIAFEFDDESVLRDFSFEALPGRHTVLKGESGSGKSTILQLLLGFHKPKSGTIAIDQSNWNPQELRKQTAWLPQDLNIGSGTVQEILDKPFRFSINRSHKPPEQKLLDTLRQLGLETGVLEKQFRDLSTGQRQRIGLAICHLLDKPLLLLDEPTSALDKGSKQKAADLLLQNNRTIISTSHDPFWVAQADNIIELHQWK